MSSLTQHQSEIKFHVFNKGERSIILSTAALLALSSSATASQALQHAAHIAEGPKRSRLLPVLFVHADAISNESKPERSFPSVHFLQQLQHQYDQEMLEIEDTYSAEYTLFVANWNVRMADLEARYADLEQEMAGRHEAETARLAAFHEEQPFRPKQSRDLTYLKVREAKLAGVREFSKAQHVRRQAEMLEEQEFAEHQAERRAKQQVG